MKNDVLEWRNREKRPVFVLLFLSTSGIKVYLGHFKSYIVSVVFNLDRQNDLGQVIKYCLESCEAT